MNTFCRYSVKGMGLLLQHEQELLYGMYRSNLQIKPLSEDWVPVLSLPHITSNFNYCTIYDNHPLQFICGTDTGLFYLYIPENVAHLWQNLYFLVSDGGKGRDSPQIILENNLLRTKLDASKSKKVLATRALADSESKTCIIKHACFIQSPALIIMLPSKGS